MEQNSLHFSFLFALRGLQRLTEILSEVGCMAYDVLVLLPSIDKILVQVTPKYVQLWQVVIKIIHLEIVVQEGLNLYVA